MKSKNEEKLEKEFKRLGVKPRVYHFRDVYPFNSVTVVTENTKYSWEDIAEIIWKYSDDIEQHNHATHLLERLKEFKGLYGVAICNKRDNFSRQQGRNIAKGRLLQYLIKENKNEN